VVRRRYVGFVSEIKVLSREMGNPPFSPILRATFEYTLITGEVIEYVEEFGPEGIMNEGLNSLLSDLRKLAGLN
jgi:hypothetical protein